ncbi:hypothetical protein [Candidatus Regiella insecticola]|uniref:Uncharacterized protein n=1 Tax=Candidatus Regiella insecticola TaxID=138073 RepID=A0A6L2ZKH4_9ENTR|nr:hypothetical protein [Candidatus Regiella insecticola]GFN45062.1 hypothetical protein RINTU1_00400 [Candidatus Regiella insecticola]
MNINSVTSTNSSTMIPSENPPASPVLTQVEKTAQDMVDTLNKMGLIDAKNIGSPLDYVRSADFKEKMDALLLDHATAERINELLNKPIAFSIVL